LIVAERRVQVTGRLGLHARAAANLVRVASQFKSKLTLQRAITRVTQRSGVLLLTDMFGGTPTNIASMFLEEGAIEVVTGVNLPMVIKLATATAEDSLSEIARKICDQGRQGIYLAGALLAQPPAKTGAD
jgi:PTS system mannose-specific IIA component